MLRDVAPRIALWLLLGGWAGAWGVFAFLIAPLAFRVLPPGSAGPLVGPLLDALHIYGIVAGVGLAALASWLRRGRFAIALALVLAAGCVFTQFVITAGIDAARPEAFGPNATAEAAQRFASLHTWSQWIFGVLFAGVLLLLGLHARADAPVE